MDGDESPINRAPMPENTVERGYDWVGPFVPENQERSLFPYDLNAPGVNNAPDFNGLGRLGSADSPGQYKSNNIGLLGMVTPSIGKYPGFLPGATFMNPPYTQNTSSLNQPLSGHFIPQIFEDFFSEVPLVNDQIQATSFTSNAQRKRASRLVRSSEVAGAASSLEIVSQGNIQSKKLESIAEGSARQAPHVLFKFVQFSAPASAKRKRPSEDEGSSQLVLQRKIWHNDNGSLEGVLATRGQAPKVRGSFDEESRIQTRNTRKIGACARCRTLKQRCSPSESLYRSCKSCRTARPYILRMPCFQSKISEASFFRIRPGVGVPLDATKRKQLFEELSDIPNSSRMARTLILTQDLGSQLSVLVSEFRPVEGDKTSYTWKTNSRSSVTLEMPSYCLTSIEATKGVMRKYLDDTGHRILQAMLEVENDLTWDTIRMAMKFATYAKGSIVARALDIWSASRMIEHPWRVCGGETLGVEPIDPDQYPSCPYVNTIPVPPIMAAQLDQVVIQGILVPLRNIVLKDLQHLIEEHEPQRWFEIYLTIFVLLNSVETATAHSGRFARNFGFPQRYTNFPQIEGFFHSCKVLLAHFHFVCNGAVPLTINWHDPKASKFAKLDKEQVKFMKSTQDKIRRKSDAVISLREKNKYDSVLYWSHQLFFENWKPGITSIEDESP